MRVITEAELREQYKKAEFTSFQLPPETKLTPSAQQFLSDRRIPVYSPENIPAAGPKASFSISPAGSVKRGFVIKATGEIVSTKPEHMTHLRGNILVPKDHPVIRFRGKLDSFQAVLINTIIDVECTGHRDLAGGLGDLLDYVRKIMSAEVRGEPLEPIKFRDLDEKELRERSHHPNKYYGIGHLIPQPAHGRLTAQLNLLRAQWRELEVSGIEAFAGESEAHRPDILQSLNRVSSLIYVMMLELTSGQYRLGRNGSEQLGSSNPCQ